MILTAAKDSNFIVVISTHYLREKFIIFVRRNKDSVWIFWSIRFNNIMHLLSAFLEEMFSFIMFLKVYSDAQSNIEAFVREKSILWWVIDKLKLNRKRWHSCRANAYTELEYDVSLFKQFKLSKLLNIQLFQKNAFDQIRLRYCYVRQHFDVWRLKFLFALSMLKDFKLMNITKDTEVIVKFKIG